MNMFEEVIENLHKEHEVYKKYYHDEFKRLNQIIGERDGKIENLEKINESLCDSVAELEKENSFKKRTIEFVREQLYKSRLQDPNLINNVIHRGYVYRTESAFHVSDPRDTLEYKIMEKNIKEYEKKREELQNVINSQNYQVERLRMLAASQQSNASEYISKYMHLRNEISLIMEATVLQRLNRTNSQGVSYDKIKLEPEE